MRILFVALLLLISLSFCSGCIIGLLVGMADDQTRNLDADNAVQNLKKPSRARRR
ncbi:hypothetical protein BOX15_Mlig012105g2 [Macrostomum lignano]|uniref:Uncharacterized protein n=1 Tax=Macrostomum lignano TaxID=282301 RepID=A0A267EIH4_9PLAT|nr:hypothetical protein BOX15_Mlig012105g1 [Macrostomum lignano]PAA92290.1 hypothetical protein BOX15_Mlig012105g2 [Macrostomum lignano]